MDLRRGSVRVLLADAEEDYVDDVRAAMSADDGVEVVGRARDGAEAVALARELAPDVVVVDAELPPCGLEATRRIVESDGPSRVLVVSRSDVDAHTDTAHTAGAVAFVTKRARPETLVDLVLRIGARSG